MRIGLAQTDSVLGDIEHNLNHMREFVRQAHERSVDLLVFPELCVTGYALGQVSDEVSLTPDDPRFESLLNEAGDMSLVFGFYEDSGLRTYNSAAYYEAGRLVHVHRKLYLPTYGIFEERKHFSPGQNMRAFRTQLGPMALAVCNDAWQPALPFLAVQDGAQVLLIPSNSAESHFPDGFGNAGSYWRTITLFYARVLESFVVFVNRVGTEEGFEFWGLSHVVDPSGAVVAQAPASTEALITADIDLYQVRFWRRKMPLVKEARLGLLRSELDRLVQIGGDL